MVKKEAKTYDTGSRSAFDFPSRDNLSSPSLDSITRTLAGWTKPVGSVK